MEYREKVLAMARVRPVLPTEVAKALSTNSMLAGAMLAEMSEKGLLKLSSLKVGGSPVYFVPGNEAQLLGFTESMNGKDRQTVQLLEREKVLRDAEVEPLVRVSLRAVKDFAVPLTVSHSGTEERFWKWFLLDDKEAEALIRQKVMPEAKEQEKSEPVEAVVEEPAPVPVADERPSSELMSSAKEQPVAKASKPRKKASVKSEFWPKVEEFLKSNKIALIEKEAIRKTEFDLLVEIPSSVGTLTYYCKARSKKRVSDADVSAAYVQGQIRKLPVLLLIDGELTKTAKELQPSLKGMTITQVGNGS